MRTPGPAAAVRAAAALACASVVATSLVATGLAPPALGAIRPAAGGGPAVTSAVTGTAGKKGVSAWAFNNTRTALAKSGASWYYTWAPGHPGISTPRGVQFVPMIWGASEVTTSTLHQVRREGPDLLTFNEPDSASQSNLTVAHALALWPRLMATGMTLGSPAVATDAATPGDWLDRFMAGIRRDHDRVNFITVHWYGADFATGAAVAQLHSYLQAIHHRYHKPIWLTEFALIRFSPAASFPSARRQAAFITAAGRMLRNLSYVRRYAWFALPATSGDGTAGLFRPGPVATTAGRAFEAVRG